MIPVGIDVGFGYSKIVAEGKHFVFPSVLGLAEADVMNFNTPGAKAVRSDIVTFKGVPYLFGQQAITQSRVASGRQDRDRIGSDEELALALIALAKLRIESAAVVTGLPVTWMRDRERLIRAWKGTHRLEWGKRMLNITIESVVVIPQPLGGYYAWALNDDGVPVQDKAALTGTIGMLDIGWNTTDITGLDDINPVQRWCGGAPVGTRRVIEAIETRLQADYGITRRPHEIDQSLQNGRTIHVYGEPVEIGEMARKARTLVAAEIMAATTRLWGNSDNFDHVLIFGGGAGMLGDELKGEFRRNGHILPKPGLTNAIGFSRLATRMVKWAQA